MPEPPAIDLTESNDGPIRSCSVVPTTKSTPVERFAPYVLLGMGMILFVAALVTVWTVPGAAAVILGGSIICVVLSAVIHNSDELELGRGLFRSTRHNRER